MAHPPPALSPLLQEKLQRGRRAESEKLAFSAALPRVDMSASVHLTRAVAVHGSPFRPPEPAAGRPRSSAGIEPARKKGLGLKEMEQVVSNLHKQNFDLKLELFHRRERQTALEDRIEGLEADMTTTHDINERLVEELEKRDKAVEEAVAMIVTLEARVDQLVGERTMVQQVDSQGYFCPRDYDAPYRNPAPQPPARDVAKLEDDAKVVTRMPSFLSERSENTENLRNVYLGVRSSALSLPRVAEGSGDTDNVPGHGSPTLSVLSESSFVSVYGGNGNGKELEQAPPARVDEPLALDGLDGGLDKAIHEDVTVLRRRAASTSRVVGLPKPPPRSSTAVPFQSITGTLDRIERFDYAYAHANEAAPPQSQRRDRQRNKSPPQPWPREERRDALRRVMTDGAGGVRLHEQGFPPTPDTISTSTLHRFENSDETLSQEQEADGALLRPGAKEAKSSEPASGAPLGGRRRPTHASDHRQTHTQRPQPARGPPAFRKRGNEWDSDSEDSDTRSLNSSLDIWLRESAEPTDSGGDVSPDLFGFPTDAAQVGWAIESALGGLQAGGTSVVASGYDHPQDLHALRQRLFPWASAPPPPNRRSSLHATAGSTGEAASAAAVDPANEGWKKASGPRNRHGRRQSDGVDKRADLRTPVQPQPQPPPPPQQQQQQQHPPQPSQSSSDQKRYPPLSGQQGTRAGLNRLFRRSFGGGSSHSTPTPTTPTTPAAPAPESAPSSSHGTAATDAPKTYVPMGVPSWMSRNGAADDDRHGTTPPPIVLQNNTRRSRASTVETECPASPAPGDAAQVPSPAQEGGPGTGSRRKWLPAFGRASGPKTRTG